MCLFSYSLIHWLNKQLLHARGLGKPKVRRGKPRDLYLGGREKVREEGRGVEGTTNKRNKIRREQGTPQQ